MFWYFVIFYDCSDMTYTGDIFDICSVNFKKLIKDVSFTGKFSL